MHSWRFNIFAIFEKNMSSDVILLTFYHKKLKMKIYIFIIIAINNNEPVWSAWSREQRILDRMCVIRMGVSDQIACV
jgi:hypothetical protein